MKKIILMLICLIVWPITTVYADEEMMAVIYDGSINDFRYENIDSDPPNLFPHLQNFVPGDVYQEQITLMISDLDPNESVRIYLEADNENEHHSVISAIDDITYTVEVNGKDITEGLFDPVDIGVFDKDETIDILVTFEIPTSVGNEIQNLDASVDWIFTAEINEGSSDNPSTPIIVSSVSSTPVTNDTSNLYLFMTLMGVSMVGIFSWLVIKKN